MKTLNQIGKQFQNELAYAHNLAKTEAEELENAEKIHISSVGGQITKGYEKLRNASENAEESLLLQRAIKRFYKRQILAPELVDDSGLELINELTLAGYLENDSVATSLADEINHIVDGYLRARDVAKKTVSGVHLESWTVEPLSAHLESLFNDHRPQLALSNLAYNFFLETIKPEKLFCTRPVSYEAMLLVAVWSSLLKIDAATIRFRLMERYQISTTKINEYIKFNSQIDSIFNSKDTDKLEKIVSRHSARFRVMLKTIDNTTIPVALDREELFLSHYQSAISETYKTVVKAVNRGIGRSVLFLIITKVIIGIAIEVPYDLIAIGVVAMTPLIINLLFPPIYMVLLRLTLKMPGKANAQALEDDIERVLYVEKLQPVHLPRGGSTKDFALGFQIVYAIVVLAVLIGVGYLLTTFGFDWVHLAVFYVFVSAASFLGFRLSRWIREIEVVETRQTVVAMVRDFLYMPFVVAGQAINDGYAKIAIVSRALDMLVELPLKSILRLLRRWNAFLGAKKDEL